MPSLRAARRLTDADCAEGEEPCQEELHGEGVPDRRGGDSAGAGRGAGRGLVWERATADCASDDAQGHTDDHEAAQHKEDGAERHGLAGAMGEGGGVRGDKGGADDCGEDED